jgi:hypothetical protein
VEVSDPEIIIKARDEEDVSMMKKGHSIVPSQPLLEEIEHTHKITIRLTDLGVGRSMSAH